MTITSAKLAEDKALDEQSGTLNEASPRNVKQSANASSFNQKRKHIARYAATVVGMKRRSLSRPILFNGKVISAYLAPEALEYVDIDTGELWAASALLNDPGGPKPFYFSEFVLMRLTILNELRPEVRAFAEFVLKFRNKWRGITPGMGKLVQWYATLSDKRPQDVRRYVKRLEEAGICKGDTMLPPFQLTSETATERQQRVALGEAEGSYSLMLMHREQNEPYLKH